MGAANGVRRVPKPRRPQGAHSVRAMPLGSGVDLHKMRDELRLYTDVLMGRVDPPIDKGVATLAEVANAYYSRASEMSMMIQQAETDGTILKGSKHYRFRTGELRTFIEMSAKAYELGSRRITMAQLEHEQRLT